jgi:hypothetical protein
MNQKVYIEYRTGGEYANAFSIKLGSEDGLYGIKKSTGEIVVTANTDVDNPSVGVYEFNYDFESNTKYRVSWTVIGQPGDYPSYVVQDVGPFEDPAETIRAVAEYRGSFRQNSTATVFLRVMELNSDAQDAEAISLTISDGDSNIVSSGTPEKISEGFYAYDWVIPYNQNPGEYSVKWNYTVSGIARNELQSVVVSIDASDTGLYSGRVTEFRAALVQMIYAAMHIPVYNEQAKPSHDGKTFYFALKNWNQSAGVRIFRNGNIVKSGVTVNFEKGCIVFDEALTEFDQVNADYNFRWFTDADLDRFLSNGTHMMNMFPPVTRNSLMTVDDRFIPIILYGAVVDALRSMMLSLQFQEPQLVFGGPDAASKQFGNFEQLKKNYEETWNKLLEQKKLGPYKGLTRMITTPPFSLPGGRSRWFRYLFSGGS